MSAACSVDVGDEVVTWQWHPTKRATLYAITERNGVPNSIGA